MRYLAAIDSTIERRLLVNFRVEVREIARLVPQGFEPLQVNGHVIAGVCLIRLGNVRPSGLPSKLGVRAENAAHRIAVTDSSGRPSVYIWRRDTASRLTQIVGGRVFPGAHWPALFEVSESNGLMDIALKSRSDDMRFGIRARGNDQIEPGSVFDTLERASDFFRGAPSGFSPALKEGELDSVRLHTEEWEIRPARVERLHSSVFGPGGTFPRAEFDSAFVMTDVTARWLA